MLLSILIVNKKIVLTKKCFTCPKFHSFPAPPQEDVGVSRPAPPPRRAQSSHAIANPASVSPQPSRLGIVFSVIGSNGARWQKWKFEGLVFLDQSRDFLDSFFSRAEGEGEKWIQKVPRLIQKDSSWELSFLLPSQPLDPISDVTFCHFDVFSEWDHAD